MENFLCLVLCRITSIENRIAGDPPKTATVNRFASEILRILFLDLDLSTIISSSPSAFINNMYRISSFNIFLSFMEVVMKKCIIISFALLALCGCSTQRDYETVSDEIVTPVMAEPMEICVDLPVEATAQVMEGNGALYIAEDYTICIQTFAGGNLGETIKFSTGFDSDRLVIIETKQNGVSRYESAWTCLGEQGEQVGRMAILDDGSYHYVMTVLTDADNAGLRQEELQSVFLSFHLAEPGSIVNSGS